MGKNKLKQKYEINEYAFKFMGSKTIVRQVEYNLFWCFWDRIKHICKDWRKGGKTAHFAHP